MVSDPELDEPITDLGFIDDVRVDDGEVAVSFRLPTYWCAPNFAFMMAGDIRDRISELAWVKRVDVRLRDHCTADAINDGVGNRRSFEATFPGEATGDLAELRRSFRRKAFLSRQERLVRYLCSAGWSAERVVSLTMQELLSLEDLDAQGLPLRDRYVAIRQELGLDCDPNHRAITTVDGEPVPVEAFEVYLRSLRKSRLNMEFNTHFCRGLLQTRYGLRESQLDEAAEWPGRSAKVIWLAGRKNPGADRSS
jgi:metal-sulfur cluster biosynthetic enzyme